MSLPRQIAAWMLAVLVALLTPFCLLGILGEGAATLGGRPEVVITAAGHPILFYTHAVVLFLMWIAAVGAIGWGLWCLATRTSPELAVEGLGERAGALLGGVALTVLGGFLGAYIVERLSVAGVFRLVHLRRGAATWSDEPIIFSVWVLGYIVWGLAALAMLAGAWWSFRHGAQFRRRFNDGVRAREADLVRRYAQAHATRTVRPTGQRGAAL